MDSFPKSKGWTDQLPVVGSLFLAEKVDYPKVSDHGLILNSGTTEPHPDKPNLRIHVPDRVGLRFALRNA